MANNYESLKTDGHYTMARKIFTKIKNWVESKVGTDVPANAVFTDEKVKQTHSYSSTYDNNYSVLMGESTTDYQDHTEGSRKTPKIFGNPYTGTIGASNLIIYGKTREGTQTTASGDYSHVEGDSSVASGTDAHAEGYHTTASGIHSHAEGMTNTAGSIASHAEGVLNTVNGAFSHVEGGYNTITADGLYAHVEGQSNNASASYTHVEGYGNIASKPYQHVSGKYNIEDPSITTGVSTYAEIIGNGTANDARSNARTLDWNGNEWVAGGITMGGASADLNLNGTGNTWDGTNTSLKTALALLDQLEGPYDYDDYDALPTATKMQDRLFLVRNAPIPLHYRYDAATKTIIFENGYATYDAETKTVSIGG